MAKHTKGPWRLDDAKRHAGLLTGDYHIIDAGDCVNAPDKGYVGFCVSGFMSDEDARLIAAAPDLLAALERLVTSCENHPAFIRPTNTITRERMLSARAALHLAKHGAPSAHEEAV